MKQRSPVVSTLLSLLVTLIGGGIYFYIAIPALNPKSFDFYLFLIVLCVLYMLAKFLFSSEDSQSGKKKKEQNRPSWSRTARAASKSTAPTGASGTSPAGAASTVSPWSSSGCACWSAWWAVSSLPCPSTLRPIGICSRWRQGISPRTWRKFRTIKSPCWTPISAKQLGRRAMGSISQNSNLVSQFRGSATTTPRSTTRAIPSGLPPGVRQRHQVVQQPL